MTKKQIKIWGAAFCGSAVILGAFGAHMLAKWLTPETLNSFEVGVRYQFFHGLVLLFLSLEQQEKRFYRTSALLFVVGTLLFSVSIYGLTIGYMSSKPILRQALGPVTPIGGLMLIAGWIRLLFGYVRF